LELVGRKRPGWGVGVELVSWGQSQVISLGEVFFTSQPMFMQARVSIFPRHRVLAGRCSLKNRVCMTLNVVVIRG
jgi:hypothetical protein